MNNFELECFNFIVDTLTNRPREANGEIKYDAQDREKITKIIITRKKMFEENKEKISEDSYKLLIELYDGLLKILNRNLI